MRGALGTPLDSNPASPILGYTNHPTRRQVTTSSPSKHERYHRPTFRGSPGAPQGQTMPNTCKERVRLHLLMIGARGLFRGVAKSMILETLIGSVYNGYP